MNDGIARRFARTLALALAAACPTLVGGCGSASHAAVVGECTAETCAGDPGGGGTLDPATCGTVSRFSAYTPLTSPALPACCSGGFELGDVKVGSSYTVTALDGVAPGGPLDVDFATYQAPDQAVIVAVDAAGGETTIFDSCLLQTWNASDPTDGKVRPPDETIRQFHLNVPSGTAKLRFDFTGVTSPTYLRVLGLCDFDVPKVTAATSFRRVKEDTSCGDAGKDAASDAAPEDDAMVH